MLSISKMTKQDLSEIFPILLTEFDDFWNENILKQELENENSEYIVARLEDEIVAFAGIWVSPVDIHITDIVVKKNKRNMKIGGAVLEELIKLACTKQRSELTLEVNEKNEIAQKLYLKFGFKELGKRKRYYNNEDDAIIMTLNLLQFTAKGK